MQHLKFTKKFKVTKLTYVSICHHGEFVIITQYHLLSKSFIYFVTSWYITTLDHWIIIHVCLCHPYMYVVFTWMFFRYQCLATLSEIFMRFEVAIHCFSLNNLNADNTFQQIKHCYIRCWLCTILVKFYKKTQV